MAKGDKDTRVHTGGQYWKVAHPIKRGVHPTKKKVEITQEIWFSQRKTVKMCLWWSKRMILHYESALTRWEKMISINPKMENGNFTWKQILFRFFASTIRSAKQLAAPMLFRFQVLQTGQQETTSRWGEMNCQGTESLGWELLLK